MKTVETFADARVLGHGCVGFVPTMGYLHEGHLSLIDAARRDCDTVVVSLFVNPLQFGPNEDLASYPRDLDRDAVLVEAAGADVLFAPPLDVMYPNEPLTTVTVGEVTEGMEGARRPGHFDGVATVVAKLFAGVAPDRSYFGRKDAQQLVTVRRMVQDLSFPTAVVGAPIVREADGLALSSRNILLDPRQRDAARSISRGLFAAAAAVTAGERSARGIERIASVAVEEEADIDLDYATLADQDTAAPVASLGRPAFLAVAARVGSTRLLDNIHIDRYEDGWLPDVGTRLPRTLNSLQGGLMLLTIDVGNTQVAIGLFQDDELAGHWRFSTKEQTSDEMRWELLGVLALDGFTPNDIGGVAVSSVVPSITATMRNVAPALSHGPVLVIGPGIKTGMSIQIDNPREVGADRVANAVAAREQYGSPAIVVDFGTSTNFDVVGPDGAYIGGVIAPGLEISTRALISGTAALRRVEFVPPRSPIGKGTVEAIQSGALYGHAGLVDGILGRLVDEVGETTTVVATGGLAPTIVPYCRNVEIVDEYLTLDGLRLIFDRNQEDQ